MMIYPRVRGFICTTAHPAGCAYNVNQQINYIKQKGAFKGVKKALIIGASTGYGLASRIAAAFGAQAATIGLCYEKEPDSKRTASPGWYNTAAFEQAARQDNLYAKTLNGDAFSNEIKQETLELIKNDWQGGVDLVIYSMAAPRRRDPDTGEVYSSVLKTIGKPFDSKTVDVMSGKVSEVSIPAATAEEIQQTIKVMGGEDWRLWMDALANAKLLAPGVKTVAYSYIGPELTHPIYRDGTIGKAKDDLANTAKQLTQQLSALQGEAFISVNKALVTQASAAIPVVPLYISILYKIMKAQHLHEGCIEQMQRLFCERLYSGNKTVPVDTLGFIRLDDWEMRSTVQTAVHEAWQQITSENSNQYADLAGYRQDFYQLFGFEFPKIDYTKEVDINVMIPSIPMTDPSAI